MFNNTKCISVIHVYHSSQFYCWRNPEYPEKTTNLPQVTGNTLSPKIVSSTPRHEQDWNPQRRWWYALIAQIVVNPITIRPRRPLYDDKSMWSTCNFSISRARRCFTATLSPKKIGRPNLQNQCPSPLSHHMYGRYN